MARGALTRWLVLALASPRVSHSLDQFLERHLGYRGLFSLLLASGGSICSHIAVLGYFTKDTLRGGASLFEGHGRPTDRWGTRRRLPAIVY